MTCIAWRLVSHRFHVCLFDTLILARASSELESYSTALAHHAHPRPHLTVWNLILWYPLGKAPIHSFEMLTPRFKPTSRIANLTLPRVSLPTHQQRFSFDSHFLGDGDCSFVRQVKTDPWSQRNQMLEDMYARSRAKGITALLREKIKAQEAVLEQDRAILRILEEKYEGM